MARRRHVSFVTDRDTSGLDTLLVGLDETDWSVLDSHSIINRASALQPLPEQGITSDLKSLSLWPASVLQALVTDVGVKTHEVFDHFSFDDSKWRLTGLSELAGPNDIPAHALRRLWGQPGLRGDDEDASCAFVQLRQTDTISYERPTVALNKNSKRAG